MFNSPPPAPSIILGLDETELVYVDQLKCKLHTQVQEPLLQLAHSAKAAGFSLQVASSYRSFERQLLIWNGKALGQRPILDEEGKPLDVSTLSPKETVFAILRWSALPGASRHHWGTDLDVYDSSRIDEHYQVQLSVAETQKGGAFAEFHAWLSNELRDNPKGFYRPYARDINGVAPEPWHLSYAPIAKRYSEALTETLLRTHLESIDIQLKETLLEYFSEIYQRFIKPYC